MITSICIYIRVKSAEEASKLSKACQDFLNDVEKSSKPVVAAIMGSCLGGGLETAMACHYRVAVDGKYCNSEFLKMQVYIYIYIYKQRCETVFSESAVR